LKKKLWVTSDVKISSFIVKKKAYLTISYIHGLSCYVQEKNHVEKYPLLASEIFSKEE